MNNLEKLNMRIEKLASNLADKNGLPVDHPETLKFKKAMLDAAALLDVDTLKVFANTDKDDVLHTVMYKKVSSFVAEGKIKL